MHQRTQMRLQHTLILSKLVLQRTNSLQGLELMRQSLLRLLHLLFCRLLCALRLQSHQLMRTHLHRGLPLVVRVTGRQLLPVRRSTRPHNPPGEWWKAGYKRAQSTPYC